MSYDEKSQKTLAVVKAMEEALGANSNSMDKHFHKDFRWMGNQGCGTKNNLEEFRRGVRGAGRKRWYLRRVGARGRHRRHEEA